MVYSQPEYILFLNVTTDHKALFDFLKECKLGYCIVAYTVRNIV